MPTINGVYIENLVPTLLKDYLLSQSYNISRVAVIINDDVIPKSDYYQTIISKKDVINIVCFVQGG